MPDQKKYILILDIGTTGIKGFVFDTHFTLIEKEYCALKKSQRSGGIVEQDPKEILETSKKALLGAIKKSGIHKSLFVGLGITNQRETTIVWNKKTGTPIYPAIVWEDTRTHNYCKSINKKWGSKIQQKTGLSVDPYFSASKIHWILHTIPHAYSSAHAGELLFGTIDSWVLWNFLKNTPHKTDFTNASRTLLFNIKTLTWDTQLLEIFDIPRSILPTLHPSGSNFGMLKKTILGFSLPVLAVAGDQHASLYAAGIRTGRTKITYGTGAFVSQVIGSQPSLHKYFSTTLAPSQGKPTYVLEAKVNNCGARVGKVLHSPKLLKKTVEKIIYEVASQVRKLPKKPKQIIIDGGVTQFTGIEALHESIFGIPTKKQKIYDGTALGTAMLVHDTAEKNLT